VSEHVATLSLSRTHHAAICLLPSASFRHGLLQLPLLEVPFCLFAATLRRCHASMARYFPQQLSPRLEIARRIYSTQIATAKPTPHMHMR
jgi:hypothetical protein